MRHAKLRGKIREVYGTNAAFAEAMGMHLSTLSAKLNKKLDKKSGKRAQFKREEIEKACELLGIPIEQVFIYFFAD